MDVEDFRNVQDNSSTHGPGQALRVGDSFWQSLRRHDASAEKVYRPPACPSKIPIARIRDHAKCLFSSAVCFPAKFFFYSADQAAPL